MMEWWQFFLINFGIIYFVTEIIIIMEAREKKADFDTFLEWNVPAAVMIGLSIGLVIFVIKIFNLENCPAYADICPVENWLIYFKWMWGIIICGAGGLGILYGIKRLIYNLLIKPKIGGKR